MFKKVQISQAQADKELGSPFLSPLTDCVADATSMSAKSLDGKNGCRYVVYVYAHRPLLDLSLAQY